MRVFKVKIKWKSLRATLSGKCLSRDLRKGAWEEGLCFYHREHSYTGAPCLSQASNRSQQDSRHPQSPASAQGIHSCASFQIFLNITKTLTDLLFILANCS